ncbi:tropomodulin-like isoform X2 [Paramacrobiotus metropolitanus]|uniref:tropomodulin-like isoform X2 n=1 Tax=Paramacrobiotus metropolitanus TaxID=2943436 RepID=UPI002445EED3|nr:tropomodulin-like isoform X2 [Paramacrobiotus metropolitanus]
MASKLFGRDLSEYDDLDVEAMLDKLTPAEIEELNNYVDPDNSYLPAHQRCRDQTTKAPTGPLNREKLVEFLEMKAREEKDWDEAVPYEAGTVRGKKFVPKEITPPPSKDDIGFNVDDEYEKALDDATEEDLVDLAAILGLHGMLNQTQYHAAFDDIQKGGVAPKQTKFQSIAKADMPKFMPPEPDNDTDVEATIEQVKKNDSSLKELNWNNIKNISIEKFHQLFEGLKSNTHLQSLSLANTRMTDHAAKPLAQALEENKTLKTLNVETNYLAGETVVELIRALLKNQTVLEFRASNQSPSVLGQKIEMEISKLILQNQNILRLGIAFEIAGARVRVHEHLQRNNDKIRQQRAKALH